MEKLAISVPEAAKLLGISKSAMYELVKTEGFPMFCIGKRIVIPVKGLEAWVLNQTED